MEDVLSHLDVPDFGCTGIEWAALMPTGSGLSLCLSTGRSLSGILPDFPHLPAPSSSDAAALPPPPQQQQQQQQKRSVLSPDAEWQVSCCAGRSSAAAAATTTSLPQHADHGSGALPDFTAGCAPGSVVAIKCEAQSLPPSPRHVGRRAGARSGSRARKGKSCDSNARVKAQLQQLEALLQAKEEQFTSMTAENARLRSRLGVLERLLPVKEQQYCVVSHVFRHLSIASASDKSFGSGAAGSGSGSGAAGVSSEGAAAAAAANAADADGHDPERGLRALRRQASDCTASDPSHSSTRSDVSGSEIGSVGAEAGTCGAVRIDNNQHARGQGTAARAAHSAGGVTTYDDDTAAAPSGAGASAPGGGLRCSVRVAGADVMTVESIRAGSEEAHSGLPEPSWALQQLRQQQQLDGSDTSPMETLLMRVVSADPALYRPLQSQTDLLRSVKAFVQRASAHLLALDIHGECVRKQTEATLTELLVSGMTRLVLTMVTKPALFHTAMYMDMNTYERGEPEPGWWRRVAERMQPTPAQVASMRAMLDLHMPRVSALHAERRQLLEEVVKSLEGPSGILDDGHDAFRGDMRMKALIATEQVLDRLEGNVMQEAVALSMIGDFVGSGMLNPMQLCQMICASFPYICDAVAIMAASVEMMEEQQAATLAAPCQDMVEI